MDELKFGPTTSRIIQYAGSAPNTTSPGPPEVTLQLRCGPNSPSIMEQKNIKLTGNLVTLGRAQTHTVVLNSLQISRNHCTFILIGTTWYVTDQSTNGISINDDRIPKGERKAIHEGDTLHLIPGILSYYVRVNRTVIVPPVRPIQTAHREPEIVIDEDSSSSSNSESLLSVGNQDEVEEMYVTCNDADPEHLKTKVSPIESKFKPLNAKGSSPQKTNTSPKCGWQKRGYGDNSSGHKPLSSSPKKCRLFGLVEDVEIDKDSDIEELLDVNDPPSKTDFFSKLALRSSNFHKSNDPLNSKNSSPIKHTEKLDSHIKEDEDSVAKLQLRYFQKKCQELEATNKLIVLQNKMDMDKLKNELDSVKSSAQAEQEELYKKVLELMEFEFNCCVCNDIYITATVVDCAHTFCHHCITQWCKKKAECPKCRTKITNRTKHVEMENFINRAYSVMTPEIQARREQAIKDRTDEMAIARATEEAEAEANRQRGPARNVFQFATDPTQANRLFEFLADMEQMNPNLGDLINIPSFQLPGLSSARSRGRGRAAAADAPVTRQTARRSTRRVARREPTNV